MNKPLVPTDFHPLGSPLDTAMIEERRRDMMKPIRTGGIVIGVFVLGFFIWATVFKIAGGVPAPGVVSVENNRKTVQHLEGGIVRKILVKEGQKVQAGQVLLVMDETQPRAQLDVLRNDYDSLVAQRARLEAEINNAPEITYPAELLARRADPHVAQLIRDQETLFRAGLGVYRAQSGVLGQRTAQLQNRIEGLQAQAKAVNEQSALISDELSGVKSLYDRGYAPKSRVLALERSASDLGGARGARMADIAGARQAIGETTIQLAQVKQQRTAQAADQLRETQMRLAEITPRLTAAEAVLAHTTVRAPVSGSVLGLTQFTEGGVAAPGQKLMDIVPGQAGLVIQTRIRPDHIDEIAEGMKVRVQLVAYQSQNLKPVMGTVTRVSADALTNDKGESFYTAEVAVPEKEVRALGSDIKLSPGMPVQALIVTGNRSIMSYLLSPYKAVTRDALREN